MNELIKINKENDKITVLGRDLHKFLEIGAHYKDWFPRMCEYGFVEYTDYSTIKNEQAILGVSARRSFCHRELRSWFMIYYKLQQLRGHKYNV